MNKLRFSIDPITYMEIFHSKIETCLVGMQLLIKILKYLLSSLIYFDIYQHQCKDETLTVFCFG